MQRPVYEWQLRSRALELGRRTLVMGILNVTPDSFSDGGKFLSPDHAVHHALQMLDEGADIIDIGGESTRPGVKVAGQGVSAEEELRRIMPVIEGILRKRPDAILSADTYKDEVARAAVNAGAEIVNDVSALRWEPHIALTVAQLKCGVILMHTRGRPEEWRTLPPSPDMVAEVKTDLRQWTGDAISHYVSPKRIMIDPGFGFGKAFDENYPLLAGLDRLHELGFPILSGVSRKSFIGRTLARNGKDAGVNERICGSLAAMTVSVLQGAHVIRAHEVRAAVEAANVADEVLLAQSRA